MDILKETDLWKRVNSKIDRVSSATGCWTWRGSQMSNEYGAMSFLAHRLVYELMKAPIPETLHLDHQCNNRQCVNPDHLKPVTALENIARGSSPPANNARKTHCKRGHLLAEGNITHRRNRIGRQCRVCKNALGKLASRRHRERKRLVRNAKKMA